MHIFEYSDIGMMQCAIGVVYSLMQAACQSLSRQALGMILANASAMPALGLASRLQMQGPCHSPILKLGMKIALSPPYQTHFFKSQIWHI
jgi:hypothetical protein